MSPYYPPPTVAQTAISGIAGSNTTYTSGTVLLSGIGGGITVGSTTGQRLDLSVAAPVAQSVQTQNLVDLTLAGNTAGVLALASSGTVTLAGGNNVTLSQNGNAVTISGPTTVAQTVQTQSRFNLTLSGNSTSAGAGYIQVSSGVLTLAGGNNVTLSQNGNAVTLSGPNLPAAQTGISGIAGSNTTYSSGTVQFSGVGGGITVSSNAGQRIDLSVAAPVAQTVQTQNLHNVTLSGNTAGAMAHISSGTFTLAGGNNITLSQNGNAVTISGAAAGGAQTGISGIAGSNTTYTSGSVTFSGVGGGVTIASNTGQRIDVSVAAPVAQTVQTQNLVDITLSGNTAGVMALASSGTVTLAGGNNITLSQNGNAITISGAAAGGAQTAISGIAASNTTYTSGSVTFSGVGGGVTINSNTGQRVDVSVAAPVAQTVQTQNMMALTISSNTAGVGALVSSGTLTLAAGANITLSQNAGNAVTIIGPTPGGGGGGIAATIGGNSTSGGAGYALVSSGTLSLAGGNQITLSQDGNAVTISGPAEVTRSLLFEGFAQSWESVSGINGSLRLQPLQVRGALTATEFDWVMSNALGASAATVSAWAGVYDVVNATSLNLLTSGSISYNIATLSTASYSGVKQWSMPFNMNASRGDYAMGLIVRTSGGGSYNVFGASTQLFLGYPNVATNASMTLLPFLGVYSSSTTAMPAAIAASSIMGNSSRARRYDYMFRAM